MTKDELLEFSRQYFEICISTIRRKNQDYSGVNSMEDALRNFKSIESLGVKPEHGLLTRMNDKMMRVSNLIKQDVEPQVSESIYDTLLDLSCYSCLLVALMEDKNNKKPSVETEG